MVRDPTEKNTRRHWRFLGTFWLIGPAFPLRNFLKVTTLGGFTPSVMIHLRFTGFSTPWALREAPGPNGQRNLDPKKVLKFLLFVVVSKKVLYYPYPGARAGGRAYRGRGGGPAGSPPGTHAGISSSGPRPVGAQRGQNHRRPGARGDGASSTPPHPLSPPARPAPPSAGSP